MTANPPNERSPSPVLDERVVRAAATVVAENGWASFTLERVAEAAGLSRVTLYRRGVTRESLIEALTAGAAQAYQAALWPAVTGSGVAADRMRLAVDALCALAEEHRHFLVSMDSDADPVFHLDAPTGDTRSVYLAPLERVLADGQADGSLRVHDLLDTAVLIFNVVPRTYVHLRVGHGWSQQRITKQLVAFVLAALAPESVLPAPKQRR